MLFKRAERSLQTLAHKLELLVLQRLWLQVLFGMAVGLAVGLMLGPDYGLVPAETTEVITAWLALPGQLFLRIIQMILIPLVVASIIRGLGATVNPERLRRIGFRFSLFVFCTSTLAAVIGVSLALLVQPGAYVQLPAQAAVTEPPVPHFSAEDIDIARDLPGMVAQLVPANPLASAIDGEMLGVVIFAIVFGIALSLQTRKHAQPIIAVTDGVLDVCMTIVKWAMLMAPWAVFGLTARTAAQVGMGTMVAMGIYILTAVSGLLMLLGIYYLIVFLLARRSPLQFARDIVAVQLLAFSTSSSAAVMPLSSKTAEEKLAVDPTISQIVIPLGATINMAGTALYQSVAVLFLAQMSGITFGLGELALIILTLVMSSIGSPATPGVGVIILSSVVTNFGIPTAGLALIMGVDRILDMSRTALNVTGDLTACTILDTYKVKK